MRQFCTSPEKTPVALPPPHSEIFHLLDVTDKLPKSVAFPVVARVYLSIVLDILLVLPADPTMPQTTPVVPSL